MNNLYQNSFNNGRKHSNLNQGNFSSSKRMQKKNNFNDTTNHKRFNTFNNTNRLHQNSFRTNINNSRNHFGTNNINKSLLRTHNAIHIQQRKQKMLRQQTRLRNATNYSIPQQTRALQSISNDNDPKTEALMREYELMHKLPLVLYMFDIIISTRILNKMDKNINNLLPLLPCAGGIFNNIWRLKQCKNNKLQYFLAPNKLKLKNEIRNILNYSQRKYQKHFKDIPLPNAIKYKVNGIWETDVKLIRAFNIYLNNLMRKDNDNYDRTNPIFNHSQCEYHLRIWCNGIIKTVATQSQIHTNTNDGNDSEDESSDDSDVDDPYVNYKPVNSNDEMYPCMNDNNIDIQQVIMQNKKRLNIQIFKRKLLKSEEKKDEEIVEKDYIEIDRYYEGIDEFVERVCKKAAMPQLGDAIMILMDTRNDPEMVVYVWRKSIKGYDKVKNNINIGNVRINYKKQKYFNLKYNNGIINVGQYIGLNTCVLDGYIHQYWSIFDRDIRFQREHASELWPDYYENQTLFEVKTDFDETYAESDDENEELYKDVYGYELIDKLNDEKSQFNMDQITQIEEQTRDKLERKDNNNNDDIIPDIEEYGPMKYHKIKAGIIDDLNKDLKSKVRPRFIPDLTPMEYKRVKDHAKASKFGDVPAEYDDPLDDDNQDDDDK